VRVAPLTEATFGAWAALFEACGCTCYCRYWHFGGGKNDWLARCFEDPAANRAEQAAALRDAGRAAHEARGLIAFDDADADLEPAKAVGWIKLAPRDALAKLTRQGAYRSLRLEGPSDVWSVGCFLVDPAHRRRGVARALLEASDDAVRAWGGRHLEAYPHRAAYALRDEEAWMGPEALFAACGFVSVHDVAPYPVLRKAL
jgi:GNAT superfamily N-acetyltransferase